MTIIELEILGKAFLDILNILFMLKKLGCKTQFFGFY